jgi:hypothetical protein
MSFVAHELELINYKWVVMAPNELLLAQAFDNLAQEFAMMGDSQNLSHVSPGQMEKGFALKHLLGVTVGRRGHLKMRNQFLGLNLSELKPSELKKLAIWLDGADALVFYAPKATDPAVLKGFMGWSSERIWGGITPKIPTIFWGQGWHRPEGNLLPEREFMYSAAEAWILRNFGPQRTYFSDSQTFFIGALDWMLSFS